MFLLLGKLVARHWLIIFIAWLVLLVAIAPEFGLPNLLGSLGVPYRAAPHWDDVTLDGDLEYLPAYTPSARGQRRLKEAFPDTRTKSNIVLVIAREDRPLTADDYRATDLLTARFQNRLGIAAFRRARALAEQAQGHREAGREELAQQAERESLEEIEAAKAAWDEALILEPAMAVAWHNRAELHQFQGRYEDALNDRVQSLAFDAALTDQSGKLLPVDDYPLPLQTVWTRHTDVVGRKLTSPDRKATLVVLGLSNEFMAVDNVFAMLQLHAILERFRDEMRAAGLQSDHLQIGITGSAAIGGDYLASAGESIKNTELYAILLVIVILVVVYRSPLLVAVPLTTIAISFFLATSFVAWLTEVPVMPLIHWAHLATMPGSGWEVWLPTGLSWQEPMIFKTTKIFIVVIMFGAGTDYCLFLIARYREELADGFTPAEAITRTMPGVGDALVASALTTVFGLTMMYFAQFGKFVNAGPAIGFCLVIALLTCLTLAPALLRGLGRYVFWPFRVEQFARDDNGDPQEGERAPAEEQPAAARRPRRKMRRFQGFWEWIAHQVLTYPGTILAGSVLLLLPFAWMGTSVRVTYDILHELSPERAVRQGTDLFTSHFPVGEVGPLTVIARKDDAGPGEEIDLAAIGELTRLLWQVPDVRVAAVRSLAEPLGDPPREYVGFDLQKRAMQKHRLTEQMFLTQVEQLKGRTARFEVVLTHNPFSVAAIADLNRIEARLAEITADPQSPWHGAEFTYAGITPGIRDLRDITQADSVRIQILVVLAVFAVLLAILRRPIICVYLMISVLFSYYVTVGITEWLFHTLYGDQFVGLGWTVPIFLFVILVAIGEDYNIYLTTRVFEEQARWGPKEGLRRAIVRTGGIITSCGIIMAGTFVSMMTGTLRAMIEMGFALTLGVLLDTFVVRPILVPAFLVLLYRWGIVRDTRPQAVREAAAEAPAMANARHSAAAKAKAGGPTC